jgi:Tol biopolymer transport system component/DNA-binding winged helix-turn-helix (wHTH) protein
MRVLFGPFTLDAETRQLMHGGDERHLAPKAFDLLELLVRERPRAVSKSRLLEELWPGTFVVEANLSNLVAELRAALDDDARSPRYVRTVYGRGYAFSEEAREAVLPRVDPDTTPRPHPIAPGDSVATATPRRINLWSATAILLATIVAVGGLFASRRPAPRAPHVVPLTSTPGIETDPDFSPDGEQIAFAWDGGGTAEGVPINVDLWLKLVGGSDVRRLTTDPGMDRFPAWSPDGKQIAFLRRAPGTPPRASQIYVVSALGGGERKVSDFAAYFGTLAWSPDGQWIVAGRARRDPDRAPQARGLYLISVSDGTATAITSPEGRALDMQVALSSDGRSLAYARTRDEFSGLHDIHVLALDGDFRPAGPSRVVARNIEREEGLLGLRWTPDHRSVVFGRMVGSVMQLERLDADGRGTPEMMELAGRGTCCPAAPARRNRLAYVIDRSDEDIFLWHPDRPPEPILQSSFRDLNPRFSPDGRRIAFSSGRSGQQECWIADADGSNPTHLTRGPAGHRGIPRWSHDGRRILYSARGEDGRWDVWTIDADGANTRRLTSGPRDSLGEAFSADGRLVYFRSNREGNEDIFRMRSEGGPAERITRNGGTAALTTADGTTLLYLGDAITSPLMAMTLPSGPERQLAPCVQRWGYAMTQAGLFYLACAPDRSAAPFHLMDLRSGRDRVIGQIPTARRVSEFEGLSVSPDGSQVVFTKYVSENMDLMMIDDFQ